MAVGVEKCDLAIIFRRIYIYMDEGPQGCGHLLVCRMKDGSLRVDCCSRSFTYPMARLKFSNLSASVLLPEREHAEVSRIIVAGRVIGLHSGSLVPSERSALLFLPSCPDRYHPLEVPICPFFSPQSLGPACPLLLFLVRPGFGALPLPLELLVVPDAGPGLMEER